TAVLSSDDVANSVAIQPDGQIVAAGYSYNGSNNDFFVVRYNADGSFDPSFGGTGKVTTAVLSSVAVAVSVAIQHDGEIVAAGSSFSDSNSGDFALVRYGSPCFTPSPTPTATATATPPPGCSNFFGQPQPNEVGTVYYCSNAPMPGVTVTFHSFCAQTDSES